MSGTRLKVLNLYKNLLKESKKFEAYNFRMYALRKVRDSFKSNKNLKDDKQITNCIKKANENLEVIKRQVIVSNLYSAEKLVIEKIKSELPSP